MIKAMRFGITWKILSAVFITALVVVCGMLFLVQWSFDRGFLEYVNRIEREMQQNFIANLTDEYRSYGNWGFVTDDPVTGASYISEVFCSRKPARRALVPMTVRATTRTDTGADWQAIFQGPG